MPPSPTPTAERVPPWWPNGARGRLLAAMAAVVSERGYAATRVSDVLDRTGMSRRTFYAHFANREDCFLAAYDAIAIDVLALLPDVEDRFAADLHAVLLQVLAHFEAWPEHARVLLTEAAAAGPIATARHERTLAVLAARLVACPGWRPGECQSLDRPDVAQAVLAAMARIVQRRLAQHGGPSLPSLAPCLEALVTRVSLAA